MPFPGMPDDEDIPEFFKRFGIPGMPGMPGQGDPNGGQDYKSQQGHQLKRLGCRDQLAAFAQHVFFTQQTLDGGGAGRWCTQAFFLHGFAQLAYHRHWGRLCHADIVRHGLLRQNPPARTLFKEKTSGIGRDFPIFTKSYWACNRRYVIVKNTANAQRGFGFIFRAIGNLVIERAKSILASQYRLFAVVLKGVTENFHEWLL